MDIGGTSDPYCVIRLEPQPKIKVKLKTEVYTKNLNPTINESYTVDLSRVGLDLKLENHLKTRIVIDVYDHDTIGKNDFIGRSSWSLGEVKTSSLDGVFKLLNRSVGEKMNQVINYADVDNLISKLNFQNDQANNNGLNINDFQLKSIIGRGNFGIVFKAEKSGQSENDSGVVALKCISKAMIKSDVDVEAIQSEKRVLKILQPCPFIVTISSTFQTDQYLILVTDFCPGGDLANQITKKMDEIFSQEEIQFFGAQIALALEYCHSKKIIYRDLKLENLVMKKNGYIQLIDFGLSKDVSKSNERAQTYCGTLDYMAPEIYAELPYGYAVDYWSFGILLFEMAFSMRPFTGHNETEISRKVMEDPIIFPRPLSQATVDPHLKELIIKLLCKSQNDRLKTLKDIYGQKFFSSVDFEAILNEGATPPIIPNSDFSKNFNPDYLNFEPVLPHVEEYINPNVNIQFSEFDEII